MNLTKILNKLANKTKTPGGAKIKKALPLILSLISIVFLASFSSSVNYEKADIDELAEYDGKNIEINGYVASVITGDYGDKIVITDGNTTVTVYTDFPSGVSMYDTVDVRGNVYLSHERPLIQVSDASLLKVTGRKDATKTLISIVNAYPENFTGKEINVYGEVLYPPSSTFIIGDGSTSMYVSLGDIKINLTRGNYVTVKGIYVYDATKGRYELDAREIRIYGNDSLSAKLKDICQNPSIWLATPVNITGAGINALAGVITDGVYNISFVSYSNGTAYDTSSYLPYSGINGILLYDSSLCKYYFEVRSFE